MASVSFVTFLVLKILDILVSMQNTLNAIIADVSRISETVQRDVTIILNLCSKSSIIFPSFTIVLAKKNVVSLHEMFLIKNELALICVIMW